MVVFYDEMKAKHEVKKGLKVANKIKDIMFDEDTVVKPMKEIFANEPRITGLSANIDINENSNKKYNGNRVLLSEQTEHNETETFTITFKDGTNITLNSLNDEKSLAKAKQFFEERLQSLNAQLPTHHSLVQCWASRCSAQPTPFYINFNLPAALNSSRSFSSIFTLSSRI